MGGPEEAEAKGAATGNVAADSDHHAARTPWVKITILRIKILHTVIFWILSLCVLYALFSGIADRITVWTWVAVGLLLLEGVVLMVSGWTCPLTILAERQGAGRGSVADIFLPRWFADRIFPICGTLYGVALVALAWRMFR